MTLLFSTTDFHLIQATCEIRYPQAPLVFDRTGHVFHSLGKKLTNLHNDGAAPTQTTMTADEGTAVIELNSSRFVADAVFSTGDLESFASNCKTFFDLVINELELTFFTRVGLRILFSKQFPTRAESVERLNTLKIVNNDAAAPVVRFGASAKIGEVLFRWQGNDLGTTFHLTAEDGAINAKFPPGLGLDSSINKEYHRLLLDIDYYTVSIVQREQWDAAEWITQAARMVRKETDKLLNEWQ